MPPSRRSVEDDLMLFDTDVLIWVFRGNARAAWIIDGTPERRLSVITLMELIQGARDKKETRLIKQFVSDLGFQSEPLTENIGHRAVIYMEEYGLSSGLRVGDALIAATAVENGLTLCSGDRTHYQAISELDLKLFRPD
jgi:predicted nucleic acid-binding protein